MSAPSTLPRFAPTHGGALDEAAHHYGLPKPAWIDLSTGINPWPYPVPDLPAGVWHRLPDATMETDLLQAVAEHLDGPEPDCLIATPGSQGAIQLLPHLLPPGRLAIFGFTYAEHALCWQRAGHAVVTAPPDASVAWLERADCRYAVVTNPNNPTGHHLSPDHLLDIAGALVRREGRLVVDEAFGDVAPSLSIAACADRPEAPIVLRSFGKFFGLAGVRLGLIAADRALIRSIRAHQGPWAVSGPALTIGAAAYRDGAWIAETRRHLATAAAGLAQALTRAGLDVVGGTDLFQLSAVPPSAGTDAPIRTLRLFDSCARSGLLLRRFAEKPNWVRVGLPPSDAVRDRLIDVIAAS